MAFVGNVTQPLRNTFVIGDGIPTTDGMGKTFTNPPPDVGVNYYVFIRLYSSIDVSIKAGLIPTCMSSYCLFFFACVL